MYRIRAAVAVLGRKESRNYIVIGDIRGETILERDYILANATAQRDNLRRSHFSAFRGARARQRTRNPVEINPTNSRALDSKIHIQIPRLALQVRPSDFAVRRRDAVGDPRTEQIDYIRH